MHPLLDSLLAAWSRLSRQERTHRQSSRQSHHANLQPPPPPRLACLVLRASDTRLPQSTINNEQSTIPLTSAQILTLNCPVSFPGPLTLTEAARLLPARAAGLFQTTHHPLLNGKPGKPQPLLYCDRDLDPNARGFLPPFPSALGFAHALALPHGASTDSLPPATWLFTRVPRFQNLAPAQNLLNNINSLHPEHPLNDPAPRKRKSLALPPPAPDYVWYKWSGDTYLGYDRINPQSKKNFDHFQRRRALASAARKARRTKPPQPSPQGSQKFKGFDFLSPQCQKPVHQLYLPQTFDLIAPDSSHATHHAPLAFACDKCHQIRRFSAVDPNAWTDLIRYLSQGLLSGPDVERPIDLPKPPRRLNLISDRPQDRGLNRSHAAPKPKIENPPHSTINNEQSAIRKHAYVPRPNRTPSQRRPQIERLLLAGQSFNEIAKELNLQYGTILWHAQQVYKQNGVRTLSELLAKHKQPVPENPIPEIRRRLLQGEPIASIAAAMNIDKMKIYNLRQRLRKEGINLPDERATNRVGQPKTAAQPPVRKSFHPSPALPTPLGVNSPQS